VGAMIAIDQTVRKSMVTSISIKIKIINSGLILTKYNAKIKAILLIK